MVLWRPTRPFRTNTQKRCPFHYKGLECKSIGEGNGNPLQCFCLENPRDGRAWWAAVSGVAQSQTRLKRLSSSSSMQNRKSRNTWSNSKFGLGVQNEAGQRLIEFCHENALAIASTLFQQHKRRLYTWTSPDGQHRNQIDYIICSHRWRISIQSASGISLIEEKIVRTTLKKEIWRVLWNHTGRF